MRTAAVGFTALAFAAGCDGSSSGKADRPEDSVLAEVPAPGIADRDWELVELGGQPAPPGAGGKPATLRIDPATGRAAGFAGCNRYSSSYHISADTLRFGPAVSTKMACDQGLDLETAWLAALPAIHHYRATDSTLTLVGADGPLATLKVAR